MGAAVGGAGQVRDQVDAVAHDAVVERRAGDAREGREEVEADDRLTVDLPAFQPVRPVHDERDADAALEVEALGPAERPVAARDGRVADAAVVAHEDDEGVVVDAVGGEPVDHRPDPAVDRRHHGRVDAGAEVFDVGDGVHVLAGRLQGRVGRVVREDEEERGVAARVTVDEVDGLVREHVGQVVVDLDHLAPAVDLAPGAGARRPVGVEHRLGGASREVRRPAGEQAEVLVEAPRQRLLRRPPAEVPLADVAGRVAGPAHEVAEGPFVRRQPDLDVAARRVELVAVALGVAAGHQPRPRRAAHRGRDVGGGEPHAVAGEPVEPRRPHDGAAVAAEIAPAEVVGDDENHVGPRRRLGGGDAGGGQEEDEGGDDASEAGHAGILPGFGEVGYSGPLAGARRSTGVSRQGRFELRD